MSAQLKTLERTEANDYSVLPHAGLDSSGGGARIFPCEDDVPRATAEVAGAGHPRYQVVGAWAIKLVALANLVVIVWMWLHDGGATGVHDMGSLLISAGRITGLVGTYLLLIQVLLMARMPFLEWIAPLGRLSVWHKRNGRLCLSLILAHVAAITAGYALTDRISIPHELIVLLNDYTGILGALIGTVLLILVVVTSVVIVRRRLRYESWYLVHFLAYAGIALSWFHQVPNGNSFIIHPLAAVYWTALYVATLQLLILFRFLQPVLRSLWHRMRVAAVVQEGPGVFSIYLTGHHLDWLGARAGQFFLWRFLSGDRWRESHPFSLSAAPDGRTLRITVKALGDFTSCIGELKPGTRVIAEGPFGAFTEQARRRERVALMAGGIGITPIRALLEELAQREPGDVALIYRVVREEDIIFRHELETLAATRGIALHYVVGDHRAPGNEHLLSRAHLRQLLPDIAFREVYLCGPPAMMRVLEQNVRRAGVPGKFIHVDQFAL